MLTFTEYAVEFAPPNFSAETHGDELKPLMSIYVEAVVNAANLESFKPGLQSALWKRPAMWRRSSSPRSGRSLPPSILRNCAA